jgi:hypothetical protein
MVHSELHPVYARHTEKKAPVMASTSSMNEAHRTPPPGNRFSGFVKFNQPSKPSDRRRAPRCAPTRVTTCTIVASDNKTLGNAYVYNLSALGMGLLLHNPIDPGGTVLVKLTNAPCTFYLCLEMHVIRCIRVPGGKEFFVGGQFDRRLTCDELRPFVL